MRWFLSYNSVDQVLAERLKNAIERKDPTSSVFLTPKSLGVGGFWSGQLAQQISEATAFILLVGEHGLSSSQVVEFDEALERRVKSADFPLVVVLLEGQTVPVCSLDLPRRQRRVEVVEMARQCLQAW